MDNVTVQMHLENHERRLAAVEQILPTLATREEIGRMIADAVGPLATKAELREGLADLRSQMLVLFEQQRDDIQLFAGHMASVVLKVEVIPDLVAAVAHIPALVAKVDQIPALVAKVDQIPALVAKVDQIPALVARLDQIPALVAKVDQIPALVERADQIPTLTAKVDQLTTLVLKLLE